MRFDFALLSSVAPGGDIAFSEEKLVAARNFANKLWNASRLLFSKPREGRSKPVSLADRWLATRLSFCAEDVNRAFAAASLRSRRQTPFYHFWWDEFCDWYLGAKKAGRGLSYTYTLYEKALRLLHPIDAVSH